MNFGASFRFESRLCFLHESHWTAENYMSVLVFGTKICDTFFHSIVILSKHRFYFYSRLILQFLDEITGVFGRTIHMHSGHSLDPRGVGECLRQSHSDASSAECN